MEKQPTGASAPEKLRSVAEALGFAEEFLARKGIDFPRRNAEHLLALGLGRERWQLYLERARDLSAPQASLLWESLARRARHEPLAYIEGKAGFYNLDLKVDRRGLIPRPETELLICESLRIIKKMADPSPRVLDLGCGCGNIGLAILRERPEIQLCSSDISASAIDLARENASALGMSSRVEFRAGDLLGPWEDYRPRGFDLIVSNPPYVSRDEFDTLPPEVKDYEPRLALDGGRDGLDIIRRLVRESPDYLAPGGWLLLEIGAGQSSRVKEIIDSNDRFSSHGIIKDYNGHERVIFVQIK